MGQRLYQFKICYDEVSDLGYNWVSQRPDFKSALTVVKMVLNTQCYPDMEFVQKFTPLDFQVKNFTPSILPNFNSFSKKKNRKNEWKCRNLHRWQIFYTAAGSNSMDKYHLCIASAIILYCKPCMHTNFCWFLKTNCSLEFSHIILLTTCSCLVMRPWRQWTHLTNRGI